MSSHEIGGEDLAQEPLELSLLEMEWCTVPVPELDTPPQAEFFEAPAPPKSRMQTLTRLALPETSLSSQPQERKGQAADDRTVSKF